MALSIILLIAIKNTKRTIYILIILIIILIPNYRVIKNINIPLSYGFSVNIEDLYYRLMHNTVRGRILTEALNMPKDDIKIFLIGSGPGTFLSRAANSRAYNVMDKTVTVASGYEQIEVESNLPSFIPPFTPAAMAKYASFIFNIPTSTYLGTFSDWRSSLMSLYFEFGIIGFIIFASFFIALIKIGIRKNNLFSGRFLQVYQFLYSY